VDKFVADEADKIAEADRTELTKKSDELKDILKDEAAEAATLTAAADSLMEVFQRVGTAMVQNQQAAQAATADDAGAGEPQAADAASDDDVVEGEIVEEGGAS
jgi:molecular chaperone DnaK